MTPSDESGGGTGSRSEAALVEGAPPDAEATTSTCIAAEDFSSGGARCLTISSDASARALGAEDDEGPPVPRRLEEAFAEAAALLDGADLDDEDLGAGGAEGADALDENADLGASRSGASAPETPPPSSLMKEPTLAARQVPWLTPEEFRKQELDAEAGAVEGNRDDQEKKMNKEKGKQERGDTDCEVLEEEKEKEKEKGEPGPLVEHQLEPIRESLVLPSPAVPVQSGEAEEAEDVAWAGPKREGAGMDEAAPKRRRLLQDDSASAGAGNEAGQERDVPVEPGGASKSSSGGISPLMDLGDCTAAKAASAHPAAPPAISIRRILWRAQIPFLYHFMAIDRRSPSPSTLSWVPGAGGGAAPGGTGATIQRLVAGTAQSILLLSARLSLEASPETPSSASPGPGAAAGGAAKPGGEASVRTTHSMPHEGPVRCLARSPHRDLLLATQTDAASEILLFDASRWQEREAKCRPDLKLSSADTTAVAGPGASAGRGLAWSLEHPAQLLASLPEGGARLWDAEAGAAVANFGAELGAGGVPSSLAALAFSASRPWLFAACGASGAVRLWDVREKGTKAVREVAEAHEGGARCAAFGYAASADRLATGGEDGVVRLWDVPNMRQVHELFWDVGSRSVVGDGGVGAATCVEWAPFDEGVLAVSSDSGHALLWDIGRIGAAQTAKEASEAPPELLFVHGGHAGEACTRISWNASSPWLLASCASPIEGPDSAGGGGGEMHIWQPIGALLPRRR